MIDRACPRGTSFSSLIEQPLRDVRDALRGLSGEVHEAVRPLLDYGALDRGKLLRPTLLLLSGGTFGVIGRDHVRAAIILELIHDSTLLHDDVLDRGRVRRGLPTANRLWGNRTAVRLGDILLCKAFACSLGLAPDVRTALGRMIRRTCAGEIRQTVHAGDLTLTESQYLAIIGHKTAALFRGACRLGAQLTGASARACQAAARFGYNAGMAYQISDDLLDLIGDDRVLHKTLGTDLRSAKLTLPLIHCLGALEEPQRRFLVQGLRTRSLTRSGLLDVLAASGSIEYVLARVGAYTARATAAVRHASPSPMKAALLEIPGSIVRTRSEPRQRSSIQKECVP